LQENWLGNISGDFFTTSSGHPDGGQLVRVANVFDVLVETIFRRLDFIREVFDVKNASLPIKCVLARSVQHYD
jgi:hypothetical protein